MSLFLVAPVLGGIVFLIAKPVPPYAAMISLNSLMPCLRCLSAGRLSVVRGVPLLMGIPIVYFLYII